MAGGLFSLYVAMLLSSGAFAGATTGGPSRPQTERTMVTSIKLSAKVDGIDGSLELFRDRRLDDRTLQSSWGRGGWEFVLPTESRLRKDLTAKPAARALLRVTDAAGQLVSELPLESACVKLSESQRLRAHGMFLVAQDESVGMGSYAGIVTRLIGLEKGIVHFVVAHDAVTRNSITIVLPKALKASWKFCGDESTVQMCSVQSSPHPGGRFQTVLKKYSFSGGRWNVVTRETDGLWESDMPFPVMGE